MGVAWMTEEDDVVRTSEQERRSRRPGGPIPWKQPAGRHAAPRNAWSLLADLRRGAASLGNLSRSTKDW
jgi:hypothetical protein